MEETETQLPSLEDLELSIADLKRLHGIRAKISQQLGSLATKQKIRRQIVSHLYDLFEMTAEDLEALAQGLIEEDVTCWEMRDGFQSLLEHLEDVLQKGREKLIHPIKVTQEYEVLDAIVGYEEYELNAKLRLAAKAGAFET